MDVIMLSEVSYPVEGSLLELKALQYFHSKGLDINTDDMVIKSHSFGAEYNIYQIKTKNCDYTVEIWVPVSGPLDYSAQEIKRKAR